MKPVLFVGNGLNLLSGNGRRWSDLLDDLADEPINSREKAIRKMKPFTLRYEEIVNALGNSTDHISAICNRLKKLPHSDIHTRLMKLPIDEVLTTNYDYALENSIDDNWTPLRLANEPFYSLFRVRNSESGKRIWHIHGEVDQTNSIMLGYEKYVGYMQKINNFLSNGVPTAQKIRKGEPYFSKFSKNRKENSNYVDSWVDTFLECDIHMIGFGLDYTENHLWHLIRKKRALRNDGQQIGHLTYHYCGEKKPNISTEAKLGLLESFGAVVFDHSETTFRKSYTTALTKIADLISDKQKN